MIAVNKFSTDMSVENTCKEIEKMIPIVLENDCKPKKSKRNGNGCKDIIYFPARRYMFTDDLMDDLSITVKKINSSLTHVRLQFDDAIIKDPANWRFHALNMAYIKLRGALSDLFNNKEE